MLNQMEQRQGPAPRQGWQRLRRGLAWAVNGCAALLVVAFVAWLVVPRLLGWTPQVILSGSMEPTLPTGGVAFIESATADEVRAGDVLTFRRPGGASSLVTHRVTQVLVEPDGSRAFKTRGDANSAEDSWTVPGANVVGRVQWDVPYLGYLSDRVRSRTGFLLFIGIPAALIVLSELRSVFKELTRPRREEAS
jgi:signal peptidase